MSYPDTTIYTSLYQLSGNVKDANRLVITVEQLRALLDKDRAQRVTNVPESSSTQFSSAEQVADYLGQYKNARHKDAAKFVRRQGQTIEKLQKALNTAKRSEESYMNADYERRALDEYHAQNLRDSCGGNDGPY